MEQVFDLRQFILMIFKKCKNVAIVALIFALLGGAFGWYKFPRDDKIMSTSTASVSFVDKMQDATALSNAMSMTNAYLVSETFHTEMLNELSQFMDSVKLTKLFGGDSTPNLEDIKKVMKVQTKGNIIIVDVTATDNIIPKEASEMCINYIVNAVPKFNENLTARQLGNEIVNVTMQNNDTLAKDILKFAMLGLAGGIVISVLAIFFVDVFNLKLKNVDQLKKYNKAIFNEGADRAVAVITKSIGERPLNLVLTSTGEANVKAVATSLKDALKRIGTEVLIVDCTSKTDNEAATSEPTVNTILCCNDINKSTATMYYVGKSSGVVLCENIKASYTDKIEAAIIEIENLGCSLVGVYVG